MRVIPLQSGSNGNCFYVESDHTRILVDAGISPRQTVLRLRSHGRDIDDVDGLLLTHDHSDHCRYISDLSRRFDLPVYMTHKTLGALRRSQRSRVDENANCFHAGESLTIGDFSIHSIPTPHDATDGVAYVIENASRRLGILTDLGHAFSGLREILSTLDAVVIESNYDETMLKSGPYPEFLKQRIRGRGGHLSNDESARLIYQCGGPKLQWVCLCHLSEENNCPDTALRVHQIWLGEDYPLYVANRREVSDVMELYMSDSDLS